MSQVWLVALIRATTGAVVIAGAAFFATLSSGTSLSQAGVAAGAAGFAYLATRGAAEGLYDSLGSRTEPLPTEPVLTPNQAAAAWQAWRQDQQAQLAAAQRMLEPAAPTPPPTPPASTGLMGGGSGG